jgi:hypothetical protein
MWNNINKLIQAIILFILVGYSFYMIITNVVPNINNRIKENKSEYYEIHLIDNEKVYKSYLSDYEPNIKNNYIQFKDRVANEEVTVFNNGFKIIINKVKDDIK